MRLLRSLATSTAVIALLAVPGVTAQAVSTSAARSEPAGTAAVASRTVARFSGPDRYAASVAASRAVFPTGTRPDVVYLVSGVSPWESLSATAAAVAEHGAVLLTRADGIPASIATELKRLAPPVIVLVGSTSTLSNAVATQARSYTASVIRVSGSSRYQIAQSVVRRSFAPGGEPRTWVATGRVWADGLVAGAAAAARREPLLTVDGAAGALPPATLELVRDLGVTTLTLVGGVASVSPGIQAQLEGVLGAGAVTRATGADQYALAARVNALAFPDLAPGSAYLANGQDFVNALTGAFLAGTSARPLYYTSPFCVPAPVRPMLVGTRTTRVVLVGREGSLRDLVGQVVACGSTTTTTTTTACQPMGARQQAPRAAPQDLRSLRPGRAPRDPSAGSASADGRCGSTGDDVLRRTRGGRGQHGDRERVPVVRHATLGVLAPGVGQRKGIRGQVDCPTGVQRAPERPQSRHRAGR